MRESRRSSRVLFLSAAISSRPTSCSRRKKTKLSLSFLRVRSSWLKFQRAGGNSSRSDRSPPEIYLEKRPPVFCTPETGRRQSRFRVRRKDATRCEASSAKIRRQSVGIRRSSREAFRAQPTLAPANQQVSAGSGFDLLLNAMHHSYGCDEHQPRNHLM